MASSDALDRAGRDAVAGDSAAGTDAHATTIDACAFVLTVGAAKRAARNGVVAVDVAIVPARRRTVIHVVTFQRAAGAADAPAMDHAVAKEIAPVAVAAPLIAIGAAAALAQIAAGAASISRLTAGRSPHRKHGDGQRSDTKQQSMNHKAPS
jgi:hypothetical protein